MKSASRQGSQILVFGALFFGIASSSAFAAQDGIIKVDQAKIFQAPTSTSPEVGQATSGQTLRMSDLPKDGYYRVVVPGTRQIGYLSESDVTPKGAAAPSQQGTGLPPAPPTAQGTEKPRVAPINRGKTRSASSSASKGAVGKGGYLWVFADMHRYGGLDTSATGDTATTTTISATNFGAEVGIAVADSWWIAPQLATLKFASTDPVYSAKATVLSVLAQLEVFRSEPFWLGIAMGPGMGFGATVTATVLKKTSTSPSFSGVTFVSRVQAKYFLSHSLALGGELGYRYLAKTGVTLTTATSIDVNLSSLFFGAGIHVNF